MRMIRASSSALLDIPALDNAVTELFTEAGAKDAREDDETDATDATDMRDDAATEMDDCTVTAESDEEREGMEEADS